jgi:stearoyl-CoA desaturase (delta-9 desaturase)
VTEPTTRLHDRSFGRADETLTKPARGRDAGADNEARMELAPTALHDAAPTVSTDTILHEGARPASTLERALAGFVVVVPPCGLAAACAWPGAHEAPLRDGLAFAGFYLATAFGITMGYHRLFTHRSFEAPRWLRVGLAIAGSMALEGPVLRWVADHRRHHAASDRTDDPHSPVERGFWHAHLGWLFTSTKSRPTVYARDLLDDAAIRAVDRVYPLWMLLTFALPFLLGFALGGTVASGLSTLLWAGCARLFVVHHVTWCINSVCHLVGSQRYASRDGSRNVAWLALPSLGESWHNNHHAFPDSAVHGLDRGQFDPTGLALRGLAMLGVVSKLRIPSERSRAARLLPPSNATGAPLPATDARA